MPVPKVDEAFVEALREVYDAEQRFLALHQWMLLQAADGRLQTLIKTHVRESGEHNRNVEKVFSLLRLDLVRIGCPEAAALVDAGQIRMREVADCHAVLDQEIVALMARVARFEIERYRELVVAARRSGAAEAAELLAANLAAVEHMAAALGDLTAALGAPGEQLLTCAA